MTDSRNISVLEGYSLVSIIIVNYNGREVLEQCLKSIFASSYYPYEIIVVDNCSTDGSGESARKIWEFRLVKNKTNVGYAEGINIGIKCAKGDFVLLLNNDTVLDSECLKELVNAARNSEADFCQPKIVMLENPRIINSAGNVLHVAGFGLMRGGGDLDKGQYDREERISGLHGACILASKKGVEDIGFLDGNFFFFNEDTDWAWRALLRGRKVVYVPKAIVRHKYGEAWTVKTPRKFYYAERNRIIMVLSNYSNRSLILLLPLLVVTEIATLAYCLFQHAFRAKILVYADVVRMRKHIFTRRKLIQGKRKVSDRIILKMMTYRFEHPFFAKNVNPLNVLYGLLYKLIAAFI